jgi:hypothetical protein
MLGYHAPMSDASSAIARLRELRVKPQRDLTITDLVRTYAKQASSTNKKLGELIELWEQHVPAALASRTTLISLRAGTLHVAVNDASTGYELDRLLREGLEQTLRSSFRGTLARVRLRVSSDAI